MGETLNEQCRVRDEGLRAVNTRLIRRKGINRNGIILAGPYQETNANLLPTTAGITKVAAVSGFNWGKGIVRRLTSYRLKARALPSDRF